MIIYKLKPEFKALYEGTHINELIKHPDFYIAEKGGLTARVTDYSLTFCHVTIDKAHLTDPITVDEVPELAYLETYSRTSFNIVILRQDPLYSCNKNSWDAGEYDITVHRYGYRASTYLSRIQYDEGIVPDHEGNVLTIPTVSRQLLLGSYATEQIRSRYVFTDRPMSGLSNIIVDSFLPRMLYTTGMRVTNLQEIELPRTSYSISPFVADLLGTNRMPMEDVIAFHGYTPKTLKALLVKVKQKKLNFVFAGVGGTGMNTLFWLSEMCKLTNTVNLFDKVSLYEKESIELSNILRFPLPLSDYYAPSMNSRKVELASKYAQKLSTAKIDVRNTYIGRNNMFLPGTIIYGAPNLDCRNDLSKLGTFLCATHAANECSLWLNPIQDDELALETYGLIQLAPFFMNQVKLVLATLEFLASDADMTEKDKHIMDFSFNGDAIRRPSRTYNWQIVENPVVLTDQQAITF